MIFLISPTFNKWYQVAWRLNIWKVFVVFLIMPVGLILRLVINGEKAQEGITTIKNSVVTTMSVPAEAVSFQMIAENQHVSIWAKLVDVGPQWLPIIWGVGALVASIYLISVYMHFTRDLKKNSEQIQSVHIDKIQVEVLSKHKGKKPLSVYQCAKISSPMIVGILRPAIFLPKREYTMVDLQIILTHELTHYLRKDVPYKGLFIVALIMHWYNPFVHMMTKAVNKDMEICCDGDAIREKDQKFKSDYSDVIMGEIVNRRQRKGTLFACMGGDKKIMEERFKNIFSNKRKKGSICFFGALALVVLISSFVYANDHNVPDFDSAEYQQLLEKVATDKEAARKAFLAENKNIPYLALEELRAMIDDEEGKYDVYEAYALVGMEPPEEVLAELSGVPIHEDLSYHKSYFTAVNDCIGPHILGNGDWAIYSAESDQKWKLKKGNTVKVCIFADVPELVPVEYHVDGEIRIGHSKNDLLAVGYIMNTEVQKFDILYDEYTEVQKFNITKKEEQIEFKIPEDGEYNFYIFCPSSSYITIKWVSIDIK